MVIYKYVCVCVCVHEFHLTNGAGARTFSVSPYIVGFVNSIVALITLYWSQNWAKSAITISLQTDHLLGQISMVIFSAKYTYSIYF